MKKLLCVALALMLVLSLAACGGAGLGSSAIGTYYLEKMESEGMSVDRSYFTAMGLSEEELDEYMFIKITEKGKATVSMDGEAIEMEYDDTHMWPVDEPEEKAKCTISGGKVTLEIEGNKVIFAKK